MGSLFDSETTSQSVMRYAPYFEEHHKEFLDDIADRKSQIISDSPYTGYPTIVVDEAFFGANYLISDFPSLYDMFGKFVAGLDIDILYSQIFEDTVNSPEANDLVTAESDLMQDEIDMRILPAFEIQARDINSVMSSVFVTESLAISADAKVKALTKFAAELKYRLIPVVTQRWGAHLNWNSQTITQYSKVMALYFSSRMEVSGFNIQMAAQHTLWPFTVLEYQRAALGAMTGASNSTTTQKDPSSPISNILGIASMALSFL